MSEQAAAHFRHAVIARQNILIAGGTSSGKTTLANALLAEMAELGERVILLEDTRELACAAEDCIALTTKPGAATLADLVRSTLRLRPTASSSARSAAARRSTCSRSGTPAIRAGSRPCTPGGAPSTQ